MKTFFEKITLYCAKQLLKLWFYLTKRDPRGSIYETIEELIKQDGHTVDSDESQLLGNILDLKDIDVVDIMIPRTDIVAVDIKTKSSMIIDFMVDKQMSSVLVYKDNLDNMLGYIRLIDLIKNKDDGIDKIINKLQFISPSLRTLDLLVKMRETGEKMAIVVDEYGSVDGLVIFSDLIEEIIGDIHEIDTLQRPTYVEIRENGDVIVDGHAKLRELEEEYHINIEVDEADEDITTLGGAVSALAGRVPSRGELIQHKSGLEFLVLDASPRLVKRVCIKKALHQANMTK